MSGIRGIVSVFGLSILILLGGCASTAGRHKALVPISNSVSLAEYSGLVLESEHADGVVMTDSDHQRIIALIVQKIRKKDDGRFERVNADPDIPGTLHASLNFTNYDKGNRFKRALLIGLGKIRIEALLELKDNQNNKSLGQFEVKKTFAWGGLYGGLTGIEGAEHGFSDAVAEVIFEEE